MSVLDVLIYPSDGLRIKAKPVDKITEELSTIVADMFETMHANEGIGLAATQVGIDKRIVVIDIENDPRTPLVLINPEILEAEHDTSMEEGCLSLPGIHEIVNRKSDVKLTFQNLAGETITLEADGLLAICIQHELDHLNGILFIDYFSALKRQRIKKKLIKYKHNLGKSQ